MSCHSTFRNVPFRITCCLFLSLCFMHVGWNWPFRPHETSQTEEAAKSEDPSHVEIAESGSGGETPSPSPESAAEVTVLASRLPSFQKKLRDMPFNVTFKNASDLDETRPSTLQDAVRDTEGVILYDPVGNTFDTSLSLRGFSDPSTMIVLVDGVRVNEVDGNTLNFPLIRMRDVQSIQIDRGSASSVYGSNAFGGVVHITTQAASSKPVDLFGGLEWTSFHGLRFNQGVSGTVADHLTPVGGKWTYYFNGERDDENGFRNNGEFRLTNFDIKTAYELPDEEGKIHFGLKHIDDAVSNPGELTFQQYEDDPGRTNKPLAGRKFENTILQIGADKKFWEDRLLASILASERWNEVNFVTTTGTFVAYGFNPYTSQADTRNRERDLTWQLNYQEEWKRLGNESLIGMEYRDGRNLSVQRDAPNGFVLPEAVTRTDRTAETDNVALFWNETLRFNDMVIPFFGMRHDYHWLATDNALNRTTDMTDRWHESTLSTGLTVKPLKSVDLFANYSQGFRVPTIDQLAPFGGTGLTTLQPEHSDSYETGTRVRLKDVAALKSSYFLIDVKDEIRFDSTALGAATPFGRNINVGKTRRYGFENRIDLNPVEELHLYGSYTWTRAYVRETDGAESLKDGRELGQIPENIFSTGATICPFSRLGVPYDGFKAGIYGTFTGRQHPTNYETASQAVLDATGGAGHFIKPYSVWDFMLSYGWRGTEIYFKINNVFDEKYYSRAISQFANTVIYPFGTYTFVDPGAPREYVLGCKWEFA